jgi:hypothetical protein
LFGTGAVGAEANPLDLADRAAAQVMNRHAIAQARRMLGAQLGNPSRALGGIGEGARLRHIVAERFLAIDVLAGIERGHGDGRVHVIGHCRVDRVDAVALLGDQLAPVGVGAGVGDPFFSRFQMTGVHIANGDDFQAGMGKETAEVVATHHAAHADACVLELAVGGGWGGAADGGGGKGAAGGLQEGAATEGWCDHGDDASECWEGYCFSPIRWS